MYFNINVVEFLKDLEELFPAGALKPKTVFFVDDNGSDIVTVTDPKNVKEQKYLRLYLYEGGDVPETGLGYDEEQNLTFVTYDVLDRFSGQGFTGNSQTFLSQGGILYVSENFLAYLKKKAGEENGFTQALPEIHPVLQTPLNTLDDVIGYVVEAKATSTLGTLCHVALHVDEYLNSDGTLMQFDYYVDLFDLLVKSGFTRSKANETIRFLLSVSESMKPILTSNGLAVWSKTIFVKVTIQASSGLRFPSSMLFDIYEPRKILVDVLGYHENFDAKTHGDVNDVHVFKFGNPTIYSNPTTWEQFGKVILFTVNPRFHQNDLSQRTEEVLKAMDAESCLQGKPQFCYAYFKTMEKECDIGAPNGDLILAPNNVLYNPCVDGYDISVNKGQQIFPIGHGLYMSLSNN